MPAMCTNSAPWSAGRRNQMPSWGVTYVPASRAWSVVEGTERAIALRLSCSAARSPAGDTNSLMVKANSKHTPRAGDNAARTL